MRFVLRPIAIIFGLMLMGHQAYASFSCSDLFANDPEESKSSIKHAAISDPRYNLEARLAELAHQSQISFDPNHVIDIKIYLHNAKDKVLEALANNQVRGAYVGDYLLLRTNHRNAVNLALELCPRSYAYATKIDADAGTFIIDMRKSETFDELHKKQSDEHKTRRR